MVDKKNKGDMKFQKLLQNLVCTILTNQHLIEKIIEISTDLQLLKIPVQKQRWWVLSIPYYLLVMVKK